MSNQSDILTIIETNPEPTIQCSKSDRQMLLKFELDGQVRACCLSTPFTYSALLKCIQDIYGSCTLTFTHYIRCLFSREDALRPPITNDEDLSKILATAEANGLNKLKFFLTRKRTHTVSEKMPSKDNDDSGALSDNTSLDSPPPGTIASQKRCASINTSKDGGAFIPESTDDIYSSGESSIVSRESSSSEHSSRRRLRTTSIIQRTVSSSNISSDLSQTSSNASLRRQCSCSGYSEKSSQTPSNWKLGRQLGQGAFGKVFLCHNVDTGSELAIKQISIRRINSETTREVKFLEGEINIYKQLDHERIVRYHGVIRTDDYLQIFMEYMTGGSVREQIINYGALTEQLTKKYTKQILIGLEYLHENRYIHRDIKCANILRDISGNIKLGDFGTSKRLIAITNHNQPDSGTIGTAHWTAPEIIQGSIFGRKADIWSLGCTIIEMLTTGPPWKDLHPIAAIFHIVTCDKPAYQLPENISSFAREFIDACLTKDYQRRPTTLDLLHHPFICDALPSLPL